MSKKNIIVLTLTFLAVAGFYFYFYRDWFQKTDIQISHTIRLKPYALMHRTAETGGEEMNNIIFGFQRDFRLTSIKVVSVAELQTNQYAHPLWELTSESNSVPMRAIAYGMHIRGMHPAVKGATAEALAPNNCYRLFVQAGPIKGEHDFTLTEENHVAH